MRQSFTYLRRDVLDAVPAILQADPIWCAYALADLQPEYAPYCRWHVTHTTDGPGLLLLFTALKPTVLFTTGPVSSVAAALAQADLPDTIYVTAREEHLSALSTVYDFGTEIRPMWRLILTDPGGPPAASSFAISPLLAADSERVRDLYDHGGPFTPDMFEAYQIDDGVFYGASTDDGQLIAVGGTHIVDWKAGIGAIGNMYTHPDWRGQGLGGAILHAIVAELGKGDVTNVILNVDQRNPGARRLYERHGFTIYCPYVEGFGKRQG